MPRKSPKPTLNRKKCVTKPLTNLEYELSNCFCASSVHVGRWCRFPLWAYMHSFQSGQFFWQASRSDDLETEQTPRHPEAVAIFVATELRIRQIGDRERHTNTFGVQTGNPPPRLPRRPTNPKVLRTDVSIGWVEHEGGCTPRVRPKLRLVR